MKILLVPGRPGTGPGTAHQRKLGRSRKEGKSGKGRKEGREGKRKGRQERVCGADDGWIDGHRREQDIERREGGLGRRQNEKREGNERVRWTVVFPVCFIDHTW